VEVIRGPKLPKMSSEITKPVSLTALSNFAPVVEFLHGAGQSQLVSQVTHLYHCPATGDVDWIKRSTVIAVDGFRQNSHPKKIRIVLICPEV